MTERADKMTSTDEAEKNSSNGGLRKTGTTSVTATNSSQRQLLTKMTDEADERGVTVTVAAAGGDVELSAKSKSVTPLMLPVDSDWSSPLAATTKRPNMHQLIDTLLKLTKALLILFASVSNLSNFSLYHV